MRIGLVKKLVDGEYCVIPVLKEFTADDSAKAQRFGVPKLKIRTEWEHGERVFAADRDVPVTALSGAAHRGFDSQGEAEEYMYKLAEQIRTLMESWTTRVDTWSGDVDIDTLSRDDDF